MFKWSAFCAVYQFSMKTINYKKNIQFNIFPKFQRKQFSTLPVKLLMVIMYSFIMYMVIMYSFIILTIMTYFLAYVQRKCFLYDLLFFWWINRNNICNKYIFFMFIIFGGMKYTSWHGLSCIRSGTALQGKLLFLILFL